MAKIAKLQKDVDGVLNTIYPSTITEAVINIESSKSLKDELTDINNKIPTKTSDITNDSDYITSSEVDTKINSAVAAVYKVRGSVDNYESLPISNVTVGDVYNLLDTGSNYVCISIDPIIWDKLSETINLSSYSTTEENDAKYQLKGDYITSIPDEYVTDTELEAKGYATATSVEAALATKLDSSAYTAATSTTSGYMSSEDYIKLAGIEENADVNIIEAITVNGDAVSVTDKTAVIEVNETHGVLLDEVPTDTTLTYQDGDKVKSFTIGMSAIYPDTESEDGYSMSFFKGTTSEGKAIWGKGGGGAGSLNETVMISLLSNQDEAATPDADLLGKSVHVIYGDQDKELVWQGEVMKTTVPMNMTYQVVFPSDDRYKCPAQQERVALAGMMREVNGLYYTEAVTVNVTCDDGTSAEGQQVTINGTIYDVDATGSVTAKIPFDVEYTVSVNTKSGYTSPSSVTETANSKTKTISMEYILIVYGVFIEATDGTLHQSTEWTGAKTANSIVVKQPTVAFRIALTQSSSMMKIHSSHNGALENYMTAISDSSQAKLDMKSAENTANIMKLQSGTDYAAGYCNAFTFPDDKTKGLLPALGWLQTAYDNKAAVDACLAACGATAMDTSGYHWASTFWGVSGNSRACWELRWSDGSVTNPSLGYSNLVRPFAEYA